MSIIENVFRINRTSVNNEHPGYKFYKNTEAINFRPASSVGIFTNSRGKKVFIKDYGYNLQDLDFEYLHNEINTLKILSEGGQSGQAVRTPQLIEAKDENGRISIIREYVSGKTLEKYSVKVKVELIIKVIRYLQTRTMSIPAPLLKSIGKRSHISAYLTFPLYLLRAAWKEPRAIMLFLKGWLIFQRYMPGCIFQRVKYSLSHRDMSVDNILYDERKKQIILLDTECMVLADFLIDIALLPRLFYQYLGAKEFLSIFRTFGLSRDEYKRLIVLMITSAVSKNATETKNSRDYLNALEGLKLSINTLIPDIEKKL